MSSLKEIQWLKLLKAIAQAILAGLAAMGLSCNFTDLLFDE
jgi:hypothetical protein